MQSPVVSMKIQHGERTLAVTGRKAWALDALITRGDAGVTPLEHVGPRWSDYIHKLRKDGLDIETVDEKHGGPFAGLHARYVLKSPVTVIERVAA
jgi:hypothetical protein